LVVIVVGIYFLTIFINLMLLTWEDDWLCENDYDALLSPKLDEFKDFY